MRFRTFHVVRKKKLLALHKISSVHFQILINKIINDSRVRFLPQQFHWLIYTEISPIHLVGVHFWEYERSIIRGSDFTVLDGGHAGRSAFKLTLAQFLRGGVDHLPAPIQYVHVGPGHPNFVPYVIVPAKGIYSRITICNNIIVLIGMNLEIIHTII